MSSNKLCKFNCKWKGDKLCAGIAGVPKFFSTWLCLYPVDNHPSKHSNHINIFDIFYCFHSAVKLLTNVVIKYQNIEFWGNSFILSGQILKSVANNKY